VTLTLTSVYRGLNLNSNLSATAEDESLRGEAENSLYMAVQHGLQNIQSFAANSRESYPNTILCPAPDDRPASAALDRFYNSMCTAGRLYLQKNTSSVSGAGSPPSYNASLPFNLSDLSTSVVPAPTGPLYPGFSISLEATVNHFSPPSVSALLAVSADNVSTTMDPPTITVNTTVAIAFPSTTKAASPNSFQTIDAGAIIGGVFGGLCGLALVAFYYLHHSGYFAPPPATATASSTGITALVIRDTEATTESSKI